MGRKDYYGVFISVLFHGLILLVPITMTAMRHTKEIELFVIDQSPIVKEQANKKLVISKKAVVQQDKRVMVEEPFPHGHSPVETLKEVLLEPSIPSKKPEQPVTASLQKPSPQGHPAVVTKPAEDVAFGSAEGPRFLQREMPVYPMMARRLGKEGRILLRLSIDEQGRLLNIEVLEGAGYGLTEAAVEAVRKSTFQPARRDGKAIAVSALLPIKFTLKGDGQ